MTERDPLVPRLTTAQAAARLGVKPATLYAYVARGMIVSRRSETGGSTFDALDVEALARANRRGPRSQAHASGATGRPLAVVDSSLTLLNNDRLFFRGVDAVELSRHLSFESAVEFLWNSGERSTDFRADPDLTRDVLAAGELLGAVSPPIDRFVLATTLAGSRDPFREELSPSAAHAAGRTMIAAMVAALPVLGSPADAHSPLAQRLWPALSRVEPTAPERELLDAALVLCLDHDLAAATFAARVAASARAHPYAAVGAALGAFDSAVHGSMGIAAGDMISAAMASGLPERALAEQLGAGRTIPGFGHIVYRRRDPRAEELFERMRAIPRFTEVLRTVDRLDAIVTSRSPRPANLDLALGALAVGVDMPRGSAQVIFALGRTAGWIAHIVEEYAQPPLRLRPESRYTGPRAGVAHLPWRAGQVRLNP
jgi:citrate synthase